MGRFATKLVFGGFDLVLVMALAAMVVMTFGNVLLRYGFGEGLAFSEELSRYAFVWMTFLGAAAALRDGSHLGMGSVVNRLPHAGQVMCFWLSRATMFVCCALLADGAVSQAAMNINDQAPVTRMPMIFVYGVAVVSSFAMCAILAAEAWHALRYGPNLDAPDGNVNG